MNDRVWALLYRAEGLARTSKRGPRDSNSRQRAGSRPQGPDDCYRGGAPGSRDRNRACREAMVSPMKCLTASQPGASDRLVGRSIANAGGEMDKRDPQIGSLITPGLPSVLPMPVWLRKLIRRKDTSAAH